MQDLTKLSEKELCEFLLNNKKADALGLGTDRTVEESGFIDKVIYKDKKDVEIIFSYLKVADDDIIQQFTIYSKWWGLIKNSFFTIDGFQSISNHLKCGVIDIHELSTYAPKTHVEINNTNRILTKTEKTDNPMTELSEEIQSMYGKPIQIEVTGKTGPDHDPLISVRITLPDNSIFEATGKNKKIAKRQAAELALESLN
jgi:hypothetical protein